MPPLPASEVWLLDTTDKVLCDLASACFSHIPLLPCTWWSCNIRVLVVPEMHHVVNTPCSSHLLFLLPGMPFHPCLLGELPFILQMVGLVDSFKDSSQTGELISFSMQCTFAMSLIQKCNNLFTCHDSLPDHKLLETGLSLYLPLEPQCLAQRLRHGWYSAKLSSHRR